MALDDLELSVDRGEQLYSFDFGEDDLKTTGTNGTVRVATDALGNVLTCRNCSVAGAGASEPFALYMTAADGVEPEIYHENDPEAIGYNPNEEHAFVDVESDGDYVVWALRNDLNTDLTSYPLVMVMYAENGKGRMQAFTITVVSDYYPVMSSSNLVGNVMMPPAPIGRMAGCQTSLDSSASAFAFDDNAVGYKDRKNGVWARRDGVTYARYGYPMQQGFYFPSLETQPAVGTPIAWLSCREVKDPGLDQITNISAAIGWKWTVTWPENVPELKIGQVLTKANLGLPEMWNAASMAICYPNPSAASVLAGTAATVAELIDPTVVQASEKTLPVKSSFPDEYGFVLGPSGTTFLRKGKYYFTGLPPSISDRFYITVENGGILDPGLKATMNLIGQYVEKESGGSYLELNVLTDAEREAIRALCKLDPGLHKSAVDSWNAAVDSLATTEVKPSPRTNFGAAVETTGSKELSLVFPNRDSYEEWWAKMNADDSSEISKRFTVDSFAFSNLGTVWHVVGGKAVTNMENVAFGTWHEDACTNITVKSGRLASAKARYEELGLHKYLDRQWDNIVSNQSSWKVTYVKGRFKWKCSEYPAANTTMRSWRTARVSATSRSSRTTTPTRRRFPKGCPCRCTSSRSCRNSMPTASPS